MALQELGATALISFMARGCRQELFFRLATEEGIGRRLSA
jgi:hypothetical protein